MKLWEAHDSNCSVCGSGVIGRPSKLAKCEVPFAKPSPIPISTTPTPVDNVTEKATGSLKTGADLVPSRFREQHEQ